MSTVLHVSALHGHNQILVFFIKTLRESSISDDGRVRPKHVVQSILNNFFNVEL